MMLHLLIIDDEEDVLESLIPGFVSDLARKLVTDPAVQAANESAGNPLPRSGRLNLKVSAAGYQSLKVPKYTYHAPAHLHLHLCCEKGGSFRHALRLLKEQFFAVVVSDLRFSEDVLGARAGRYFIEDVHRRNPETFGILYSAYQRPDGFPADRFIRKGSPSNMAGEELLDRIVEGVAFYLNNPNIRRLSREIKRRGLVYQSEAFGATLRRLYDYAGLHFSQEVPDANNRRRPRPCILLDGETGTGKTELAGLLHEISERRTHPFQAANCNQLTNETFLRSALFGHVRGAFSGATSERQGLVAAAGKGLLLLDDLHTIDDDCSVILHSFLDDGEYSHLGEDEIRRTSQAAIVATVETPRWEEIKAERKLPESFISRVEQLVLRVPPLRSRPEDVAGQAQAYCAEYARQVGEAMELSPGAIAWLVDFGFPGGNSRKLRDLLKGLVSSNAKTTDYLDVGELEDYAAEIGLLCKTPYATMPAAVTRPMTPVPGSSASTASSSSLPASGSIWPSNDRDPGNWQARIARLASQALAEEYELDARGAEASCRRLFEQNFPTLWQEMKRLMQAPAEDRPMDIKLFDELLRYYVIFRLGNPAKAAKELGMKDNALREFVYSREQKRAVPEKQ
jgi:DNA-binding NtrC family response regulator